jgi:sulfane dehydrogenase subunit SoxC
LPVRRFRRPTPSHRIFMPSEAAPSKSPIISRKRDGVGVVTMDPAGLYMHVTPESALAPPVTATASHFVLAHHGIARCSAESWTVTLTDAAGDQKILPLDQIKNLPARVVGATLECAGNPEDPDKPLRIVSNAVWRGPSLRALLELMVAREARYVWCSGVDWGSYAGETVDGYVKDIPISKAMDEDVIVALEMNGAPLTPEHGFPLRLIVPGFYGTNSVKWLSAISLHDERPKSLFTTRLYNDWSSGEAVPVWETAVNSRVLSPTAGTTLSLGAVEIFGRAWGHAAVQAVELSTDGGRNWFAAELEPRRSGYSWQTFRTRWAPPGAGNYEIAVRARDVTGRIQPEGLHINQIQRIAFAVA